MARTRTQTRAYLSNLTPQKSGRYNPPTNVAAPETTSTCPPAQTTSPLVRLQQFLQAGCTTVTFLVIFVTILAG